jgi:hypothetical protein
MKNGGWLDNYNDSKISLPPGFVGEGTFNGPQWESPAPSNGKYAKKTMASAQNGKWLGNKLNEQGYITSETKGGNRISFTGNQRADEWINKQIDSGKFGFDPKTGGTFPLKKPVKGLSEEDQFIGTKQYYDLQAPQGFNTEDQLAQIEKLPQFQQEVINDSNESRRKNYVEGNMEEVVKHPLWSPGYFTPEGAVIGALQGATKMGPDLYEGNYKAAAMDALMMLPLAPSAIKTVTPLIQKAGKALGTEEGLLSNAYKLNPNSGKLGRYNRIVGNNAIEDLNTSGLVRAGDRGGRSNMTIGNVSFNRKTPYPSFAEGVPAADNVYAQSIVNQGNKPYIISTNRKFAPSTLGRHGKGSTMFPIDDTGKYLESFPASEVNVFEATKPHWLKGYKEVPKQEDGGWLDNYGEEANANEGHSSASKEWVGEGYSNVGRNYSPAWGGQFQMGGSLPGATGSMYARVGAPSNGPYAKKTLPSAQNGQEMRYYQNGLDWKPKGMKDDGWLDGYDKAQEGTKVEYGTPEYEEAYKRGEVVTEDEQYSPIQLDEVVIPAKPLTEFGKTRKQIAEKNSFEQFANDRYLGNFEKNMGQTINNLPEYRKQEYEDYINKLAFDEYIKKHPQAKGEDRGAYIDRMQAENANSSNFERAYEANADYNDATDVNKWRKGLIGLGSLVLPKPAMDYMKQESDYFSKKEKQAMIDNPISTQVGDVLGTIEPLTIPVEGLYSRDKSFGQIASGESANIPMTARILGDPMMLAFEAAPLIMEGVKGLRGASTVAKALSEESAMSKLNMVDEAVASKPWSMKELPGLHLQSTMDNGAISRIVEPKTGLINTEQALAIIGKESGGADKVALIKQGLGENIPKKIDYNNFRKTVQKQLIPLESQVVDHSSNYGLNHIGYPSPKRASYELAIKNTQATIEDITTQLQNLNSKPNLSHGEIGHKENLQALLNGSLEKLAENQKGLKTLPLENKTIVFGNKDKFGRGSNAHGNPDETLGHAHYLIDAETPDIVNLTQMQSDGFQGTHRIMPKTFNPEISQYQLTRMQEIQQKNIATLNKMKAEGAADYEIKQMQEIVDAQELRNALEKGHVENFTQKSLLDKDHQARFLQEFVNYAAQKGNINKVRVPTSETAAKVQGYVSKKHWNVNIKEGDEVTLLDGTKGKITDDTFDNITEITTSDGQKVNVDFTMLRFGKSKTLPVKSVNNTELKEVAGFMPEHQTILKKYSEQPKLIKKLFGQDVKIVTDSKGNTWYEFDIPEAFKQGKEQIKAFKQGGVIKDDRGQWANNKKNSLSLQSNWLSKFE